MNFKTIAATLGLIIGVAAALSACKVTYSLSGASIDPDIKSVSVSRFQNNAPMVSPMLVPTFTDGLQSRFSRQTSLMVLREGGDMHFEGEIINYSSAPAAIAGADEMAVRNRLTVTVRVRFTNSVQPEYNFDKNFTAFAEYDSNKSLQSVEGGLIVGIVDQLIEDIFNAAVSNW